MVASVWILLGTFLNKIDQPRGDEAECAALYNLYDDILAKQELYWQQRSRITWLLEGDRNTTYFHSKATSRARRDQIKGLFNS